MRTYVILIAFFLTCSVAFSGERGRRQHRRNYDDPMRMFSHVLGAIGGNNNMRRPPPPPPPPIRYHQNRYYTDNTVRVIRVVPAAAAICTHPSNNLCATCGTPSDNSMQIQGETWDVIETTKSDLDDNLVVVTLKSSSGKTQKILQNFKTKQFKSIQ